MKRAILIFCTILFCRNMQAQESTFRINVLAYQWTETHKTLTFNWPGHANTSCNGSVSMNGYAYGGGNFSANGTTSNDCSTSYTPPSTQNIDVQKPVVYILAESANSQMVLACVRNVRWSQCHALTPGPFLARLNGGHFEVEGTSGKGKEEWVRFDVVRQTALATQQTQAVPVRSTETISSTSPTAPPTNAELEVASTPAGAEIQLDGSFVGSTPSTIDVAAGDHTIAMNKHGYQPWQREIKVNGGKISVAAELEAEAETDASAHTADTAVPVTPSTPPPPAAPPPPPPSHNTVTSPPDTLVMVDLTSNPDGAAINVDDVAIGKAPMTLKVKPGQHAFRMFMDGYQNWAQWITIQAGPEVHITAALEKSK
jgi:hypothetical protein